MGNLFSNLVQLPDDSPVHLRRPFQRDVAFTFQDYQYLVHYGRQYQPPMPHPIANIVLLGPVGAGKSSFLCATGSHLQGRMVRRALTGDASDSLTTRLHKYSLCAVDGTTKWRVWDTAGWRAQGSREEAAAQLAGYAALLDGRLRHGAGMAAAPQAGDAEWEAIGEEAALCSLPHCVCLCIPCRSVSDAAVMEGMRQLLGLARARGIPTLVLLTKIDDYDPIVIGTDVKRAFHSVRLRAVITAAAEELGLPPNCVLPVMAPTQDTLPDSDTGVLLLHALRHALMSATDFLLNANDGIKDCGAVRLNGHAAVERA